MSTFTLLTAMVSVLGTAVLCGLLWIVATSCMNRKQNQQADDAENEGLGFGGGDGGGFGFEGLAGAGAGAGIGAFSGWLGNLGAGSHHDETDDAGTRGEPGFGGYADERSPLLDPD